MPPRDRSRAALDVAPAARRPEPRLALRPPPPARPSPQLGCASQEIDWDDAVSAAVAEWVDRGAGRRARRRPLDELDEVVAGVRLLDLPRRALADYDW